MHLITDLETYLPKTSSQALILGLGNFDGVHVGHQSLLEKVQNQARKEKGIAAVFTFSDHPQTVLHPDVRIPLICTLDHRLMLLEEFGIDICFLIPFTEEFSKIPAQDFIRTVLGKKIKVSQVCMGRNARFGEGRRGDSALMKKYSRQNGFVFHEIAPVKIGGETVSSSRIRELVQSGLLEEAGQCLGRPFSIIRKVVKGSGLGHKIGFPTVNLAASEGLMPPFGVYPVKVREVHFSQKAAGDSGQWAFSTKTRDWINGVLNYGMRPTVGGASEPVAEAHLMDFKGDLYGSDVEVMFFPRLRNEMKFDNTEQLAAQIQQDIGQARAFFQKMHSKLS